MRRYLAVALALALAVGVGGAASARISGAGPGGQPVAACGPGRVLTPLQGTSQYGCTQQVPDSGVPLSVAAAAAVRPATAPVKCYGDGTTGPRIQMIYGYPDGLPNRGATVVKQFRTLMAPRMQAVINAQSAGRDLGLRFAWTKGCGAIDVKVIKFPRSVVAKPGDPADQLSRIAGWLAANGYDREDRKYQVLWDGWAKGGTCGIAFTPLVYGPVESLPYSRRAEGLPPLGARTPLLATTGGRTVTGLIPKHSLVFNHVGSPTGPSCFSTNTKSTVTVQLHELFHTLGAVQDDAPHADRGHCFDAPSVMCSGNVPGYGGGVSIPYCAKQPVETLDCGMDDYWNPNPPATSYLATHLNIAKSQFFGPQPSDSLASSPV